MQEQCEDPPERLPAPHGEQMEGGRNRRTEPAKRWVLTTHTSPIEVQVSTGSKAGGKARSGAKRGEESPRSAVKSILELNHAGGQAAKQTQTLTASIALSVHMLSGAWMSALHLPCPPPRLTYSLFSLFIHSYLVPSTFCLC